MKIKFSITKSLVMESVKTETYLKGSIDDAANQGAAKLGYTETAGDIEAHERKLAKDFTHGIERLKSVLVDFFVPDLSALGNNSISASTSGDTVLFSIELPRRFNGALANALANYASQYVEEFMLYQWWVSTTNIKQAEPYANSMQDLENRIRKCFVLSTPKVSTAKQEEVNGGVYLDDGNTEFNGTND